MLWLPTLRNVNWRLSTPRWGRGRGPPPRELGSWKRNAKWNKTSIPRLFRIPSGVPFQTQLWNKLRSDIIGSSNPELFVVLVTAGCCDLQMLRQAATDRSKRTPEVAQLL